MTTLRHLFASSVIATLSACGGSERSADDARDQLDANQRKWDFSEVESYQFDYKGGQFFSGPEVGKWKEVHVANGMVGKAILKETGIEIPQDQYSDESYNIMTITDGFLLIGSLIQESPHTLEITYNNELGFPEVISVDYDSNVFDDEEAWYFTNLTLSASSASLTTP